MKIFTISRILIFLVFTNHLFATSIESDVVKLKLKVSSLEEEIDGIKSIIETSNKSRSDFATSKQIKDLSKRVEKLEVSIDKILKILSDNQSNTEEKKLKPEKKSNKNIKIKKMTGRDLFNKGYKLYTKHKYSEARNFLLDAAEMNYRAASSYFYIAESLYYQKRYDEAVVYYKKSIYQYDKPKYLSTLLLHTGISLYKIGDKVGAEKFLKATIDGFPDSKNAKIATKFFKKL